MIKFSVEPIVEHTAAELNPCWCKLFFKSKIRMQFNKHATFKASAGEIPFDTQMNFISNKSQLTAL